MKSIRGRLTALMVMGFSLLLIASGSAIYLLTRITLLAEFDQVVRAKAQTIVAQTEQNQNGLQVEYSVDVMREFNDAHTRQYYEIWAADGAVFTRSKSLDGADLPRRFGSVARPEYWNLRGPRGKAVRAVGLKFQPKVDEDQKGTPAGDAFLVVASDLRPLDRTLDRLAMVLLATGLLAMATTVPLVRLAVRRGHAPLDELARQAAGINAESLQVRFPVEKLPLELRPIIARLNDLLGRLEDSFERERRFSADLAHELRTPLAELRAHAEVGLQFAEGEGTESYRETLGIALQMQAIVTRLLDLARSENGKIPLQLQAVPIAPLVEEAWRPLAGQAADKQLNIHIDIIKGAEILTDATLFRSILTNLFPTRSPTRLETETLILSGARKRAS